MPTVIQPAAGSARSEAYLLREGEEIEFRALTRARGLVDDIAATDACELMVFGKLLKRAGHRDRWRRGVAVRCTRVATLLCGVRLILGDHYTGRFRRRNSWVVRGRFDGRRVPVATVGPLRASSWDELVRPVGIKLLRADLIDVAGLQAWLTEASQRAAERTLERRQQFERAVRGEP